MLETAIIGGGLCGVALARSLHRREQDFALFEARSRLGGRILSVACVRSGMAIDLGPTWFWPDTQPLVTQLIADLELTSFPQHDEGSVLHLRYPDKTAEHIDGKQVNNGARRVEGGMASLIGALTKDLPLGRIHFGHDLIGLRDHGDRIMLVFRVQEQWVEVEARRAVLALPRGLSRSMSTSNQISMMQRERPCGAPRLGWPRRQRSSSAMAAPFGAWMGTPATLSYPMSRL